MRKTLEEIGPPQPITVRSPAGIRIIVDRYLRKTGGMIHDDESRPAGRTSPRANQGAGAGGATCAGAGLFRMTGSVGGHHGTRLFDATKGLL